MIREGLVPDSSMSYQVLYLKFFTRLTQGCYCSINKCNLPSHIERKPLSRVNNSNSGGQLHDIYWYINTFAMWHVPIQEDFFDQFPLFFWILMLTTANFLDAGWNLFLLDEGNLTVRVRSLVKGNILDDGGVVDTRQFLKSREAKPMIDLLKPSQH